MAENKSENRVLLGMSGGTDSSVSAVMLQEQGFEVIGVTFLFSDLEKQNELNIKDAKEIAEKLKIDHHIIDLRGEFREQIIQRFISEYEEGKTPFPCAFCNPELKFKHLNRLALKLNCESISTGHYVRISEHKKRKYITKGKDAEKDQSFFLWGLNKEIIDKLIFPLGFFQKTEIRELARKRGFNRIAKKKDSLGICFIDENDYRNYLKNNGLCSTKGNFVDKQGNILGSHSGITHYTVGQRRGLGLNLDKPVFVSEIRAKENQVVISDFDDLYKNKIFIKNTYFVDIDSISRERKYIVRIRYRLQNTPCKLKIIDETHAEVQLLEPVAMVANGQTAVLYENDRVIGGGFIEGSE